MKKQCEFCEKDIDLSKFKILNRVKYCSDKCRDLAYYYRNHKAIKEYAKEYHLKNFERDKDKKRTWFKNWYLKNAEEQKKNVLKNYYKNKEKWYERNRINKYRHEIFSILPNICSNCGNEKVRIIHLKEYGNYPKRIKGKGSKEKNKQRRKRYYKKYLLLFCSNLCNKEYQRKANI